MPTEYAESAGDVLAPFSDRFSGTAHTWHLEVLGKSSRISEITHDVFRGGRAGVRNDKHAADSGY
jgi:hypothetical protein